VAYHCINWAHSWWQCCINVLHAYEVIENGMYNDCNYNKNQHSYQEPPDYIDCKIIEKFKGEYIIKTLLWAIQHGLSFPNQSKKTYSSEKSNFLELSRAVDGAFVICRFVNPHCSQGLFITSSKAELPHDPCYDVVLQNRRKNQVPTVVFYFPSTWTYYSPQFVSDTSQLRSKGSWLCNYRLATKTIMQMLPLTSLHIRRSDGMPDEEGQLWTFTDVCCVDFCNTKTPILTMYPLLTGVHVLDKNICIPPDIFIGKNKTTVQQMKVKRKQINS